LSQEASLYIFNIQAPHFNDNDEISSCEEEEEEEGITLSF